MHLHREFLARGDELVEQRKAATGRKVAEQIPRFVRKDAGQGAAREDAAIDTIVHALARQGEARARPRIAALGDEAARGKSGNATPEQARRLGEVAFYQLSLGAETHEAGLATLGTIAARDQEWVASWAAHTLCARELRRPAGRAATEAHRRALVIELDRRGLDWRPLQGRLGCATVP